LREDSVTEMGWLPAPLEHLPSTWSGWWRRSRPSAAG